MTISRWRNQTRRQGAAVSSSIRRAVGTSALRRTARPSKTGWGTEAIPQLCRGTARSGLVRRGAVSLCKHVAVDPFDELGNVAPVEIPFD